MEGSSEKLKENGEEKPSLLHILIKRCNHLSESVCNYHVIDLIIRFNFALGSKYFLFLIDLYQGWRTVSKYFSRRIYKFKVCQSAFFKQTRQIKYLYLNKWFYLLTVNLLVYPIPVFKNAFLCCTWCLGYRWNSTTVGMFVRETGRRCSRQPRSRTSRETQLFQIRRNIKWERRRWRHC